MEIFMFILGLGVLALLADVHEKYHERKMNRQMHGPKNWRETVYS
ncbi:hypothetical protein QGX21_gp028 [Pseudomonas phage phiPsa315]|jgi:hypothetical protein|uniref:Uncharacterized protein n=1 Tax=Pseudomonas phage phiPsa315 TaxID=1460363 RepID=A0A7G9V263_9CAUD|nr:hypothetical protein QGX21_gp028 [Pseudomonas phage phiPsa315]QNO00369.1 hypothetical protein phiPsa315_028 [Pseudomonas phage phiPsa315]